jgi:hypothetical protein
MLECKLSRHMPLITLAGRKKVTNTLAYSTVVSRLAFGKLLEGGALSRRRS